MTGHKLSNVIAFSMAMIYVLFVNKNILRRLKNG